MSNYPSGTVTFLFTDIEGSTKLAQEQPDKWETLRDRHHAILKSAMDAHNGYVFQIIGDAFCVAFHTAGEAIRAAIQSQKDLHDEDWGDTPVKVRMGINTGTARASEDTDHSGGYSGHTSMARVQRLMSAAHGGQTLISLATEELVRDDLPENISLRDMGKRRLKDLIRPEHIYQLIIPTLPVEFPPIKTLDAYRHNLPIQLTSFVGREKEVQQVEQTLKEHRLVTLTGSAGTGKTRLSLQVAADMTAQFIDGVWIAELASVSDPDLALQTILFTLGINEQKGRTTMQMLTDYLQEKDLLLVLDNCEHLIEASALLADTLLNHTHHLKILATSREALGVKGEATLLVPSLSLSWPSMGRFPSIEQLRQCEAVQLFIERAVLVKSDFKVDKDNAPFVLQICSRLDGIPLAIELAASRVRALSVEQIAVRLDDRFRLLTGGARTTLPRQQTLRAALDWSYNLLPRSEQVLFRRLSVFVGGWTLEAAESVCSDDSVRSDDVLELLEHLINKSIVIAEETGHETRYPTRGSLRYRMLETMRQYANEKLVESGESDAFRDRHLQYFLKLAEEARPNMRWSDAIEWHDRIEVDHDNFRLALDWTRQSENRAESGLRLVDSLSEFWLARGFLVEGRERSSAALKHARSFEGKALYANVLRDLAWYATSQGDFPGARVFANESLAVFRELGDKLGISNALQALGTIAVESKDYELAESALQEALQNRRSLTDVSTTSLLATMGWAAFGLGDYALARQRLNEAFALSLSAENKLINSGALQGLAEVDLREGRYESASTLIEESLAILKEIGDKWRIGAALGVWAWIAVLQHDWNSAFARLKESTTLRKEIGDTGGVVWCLEKLGQVAFGKDSYEKAVKIFGAAAAIRNTLESEMDPFDQPEYESNITSLRNQLGEEKFNELWNQGRSFTLEKAIDFALEETS